MSAPAYNSNNLKHGIYSLDKGQGMTKLTPFELDTLADLREMARSEPGRLELKIEIIARLTLIARKFFSDAFESHKSGNWWNSGVVARGGSYLSELRRWLESIPPEKQPDLDLTLLEKYKEIEDKDASNH